MTGHRRNGPRVRLAAAGIATVAFLVIVAVASPALAGPARFSQQTPAPGSSVQTPQPLVSVRAEADAPIQWGTYNWIKVDGLSLRSVKTVYDRNPDGTYDYTKATLSATVHWTLADGSHAVQASIFADGRHTTSWTFTVGTPPVITAPSPAPGSTVSAQTPVISAVVSGAPGTTVQVWLDGVELPSTFAAGVVTAPVTEPLPNESLHDVVVTAVTPAGLSSTLAWAFSVQIYPAMTPETACTACHLGYPLIHPVDDCAACHGPGSPYETGYDNPWDSHAPGTTCSACHGDLSDCTYCHGQPYATVPPLHDLVNDPYHQSSTTECGPCHARRLSNEHNRYGLSCLTCHVSDDPAVAAAIASGDTACEACHPVAHGEAHSSSLDPSCADCHAADLVVEHLANQSLACGTCHESADPLVVAAIAAGDTSCVACHGEVDHAALHESVLAEACAGCHAPNLVTEHVVNRALACADCHASADAEVVAAIATGDTACDACHEDYGADISGHPYVAEPHVSAIGGQSLDGSYPSGASYSVACTACHLAELKPEHDRPTSSAAGAGCLACHPAPRDTVGAWDGSCVQGGCHAPSTPAEQHAAMDGSHVVPAEYAQCTACHDEGDAGAIHAPHCEACHSTTVVPDTLDCASCHPEKLEPHGYDAATHLAAVSAVPLAGLITDPAGVPYTRYDDSAQDYSGQRCGQCHSMDLLTEHTKPSSSSAALGCQACHPSPRNTFATWNKTCQQAGCHATIHADMALKHVWSYTGATSWASCGSADSRCHPGEWKPDLAAVHEEPTYWGSAWNVDFTNYPDGCRFCHYSASAVPATPTACTNCHPLSHNPAPLP